MSWSTSELRVWLAPLNRFKPSSKIFYWPFQGGTSFVDLLCFCSVLCLLCFVRVCLYVLRGHLLGKGWPLGSRLWCLLWVCHFPIGILGQVWYLIVSIPDLCNLTYFVIKTRNFILQKRNKTFRLRNCLKERFGPGLFDEMEWSKSKGGGLLNTCATYIDFFLFDQTTRHLQITDFHQIKNSTFKSPFSALPRKSKPEEFQLW